MPRNGAQAEEGSPRQRSTSRRRGPPARWAGRSRAGHRGNAACEQDATSVALGSSRALGSRSPGGTSRRGSGRRGSVPMARVVADPRQTKFVLDESRIPRSWYNIAADLPEPPPPVLHPGTGQPIGPGDLAPLFPMELMQAGRQHRPRDRDPGAGARRVSTLPPEPALSSPPARARARYAGAHLLQVRGRQPVWQPQAEHRARSGLLQQGGGRHPTRDRNRRRAVGERAGVRRRRTSASRSRSTWSARATTRSRTAGC